MGFGSRASGEEECSGGARSETVGKIIGDIRVECARSDSTIVRRRFNDLDAQLVAENPPRFWALASTTFRKQKRRSRRCCLASRGEIALIADGQIRVSRLRSWRYDNQGLTRPSSLGYDEPYPNKAVRGRAGSTYATSLYSALRPAMHRSLHCLVVALVMLACWRQPVARSDDLQAAGIELFEKKIRPILATHCYECHSAKAKELEGDLRLDTPQGIRQGGESGLAVVPGDAKASMLIEAIRHEGLEMPPDEKLPARVIADFERWIAAGASYPPDSSNAPARKSPKVTADGREFWAFQRPVETPLPSVNAAAWATSPIDRFVLSGLEGAGLAPAGPADKRALIRRATFDLTGLPPTPDQIDRFLADDSPDAFATVVDRLLASPRYGERWGRHWLDVARYADSNGVDENLAYIHAFRYRDYVIDAFNKDKPYDRFIHEQLAGDLLAARENETPDELHERLIATGFLSLGAKMLACDDPRKMQLDIIDEQVDTVCRALMAMTMGCARCHDHKFDPLSIEDYYSLAGIFKSTKTMENFRVVAVWHEHVVETEQQQRRSIEGHEQKIRDKARAIEDRRQAAREEFLAAERRKAGRYLLAAARIARESGPIVEGEQQKQNKNADPVKRLAEEWQLNDAILKQWVDYLRGTDKGPKSIWHTWEKFVTQAESDSPNRPLDGPSDAERERLANRYQRLLDRADEAWQTQRDGGAGGKELGDRELERHGKVLYGEGGPYRSPASPERFYSAQAKADIERLNKDQAELAKSRPQPARAMGVRDGKIEDLRLHVRGSYLSLGKQVPRRFPSIFAGDDQAPLGEASSGRLQLAEWFTSPDHPLTARVMVNRIWQWHFGKGIVRSPDNFGNLGQRPTDQAMLDWLAVRFVKSGWSIKQMHRLIMLSSTYQMGTAHSAAAAAKDPENRLLWRFERRRLEAEQVRDAVLAVGGRLDLSMYGQLLPDKARGYVTGTGSKQGTYDFNRRSVYLPVLRSAVYQVFQAFDFADPSVLSGKRSTTTVAPQALFMMNGKIVLQQSRYLAENLLERDDVDDAGRLRLAYERVLGRPPTPAETDRDLGFLVRYQAATEADHVQPEQGRVRAWQGVCRVLLASNEFIYVP